MISTGMTAMVTRAGAAAALMKSPTHDTTANAEAVKKTKTMKAFGRRSKVR